MRTGHIKVARKLFDGDDLLWEPARPRTRFEAWLDIIQLAAWKDRTPYSSRERGVDWLTRGEFVGSVRYLGERWQWGKSSVQRFFALLEKAGRIAGQRMGHHGRVYLIVNYDAYQSGAVEGGTHGGTQSGTVAGQSRDKEEAVKQLSREEQQLPPVADATASRPWAVVQVVAPLEPTPAPAAPAGRPAAPEVARSAAKAKPAPKYPHYPKSACDVLHTLWLDRRGPYDYARFRRETAGLFPSDPPPYTLDELAGAFRLALAVVKHRAKVGLNRVEWNVLKPEHVAQRIVEWVEDYRRTQSDPDYLDTLFSAPAGRGAA